MRAKIPPPRLYTICEQISLSYRFSDLMAARPGWRELNTDLCSTILTQAERFASNSLGPLNYLMDRHGCQLVDGRVVTSPEHREAWEKFVAGGWPTLEAEAAFGGQGLPRILAFAVQEQFDRQNPAFGMLSVGQRSLFKLISAWGTDRMKATWLEKLVSGEWGATICVSEAGAGSDLSRTRALAEPTPEGDWKISGTKCWITFGDHDLTPRTGHAVLAMTREEDGQSRPSLFLVPSHLKDGSINRITVHRIEEKLGLHGSPTCELGFDEAHAMLLGQQGRGLAQLFVMIANMRLAVGAMGLGIAGGASDLAMQYAEQRVQGGHPEPVAIANHADVKLQLIDMLSACYLLRGLLFAAANCSDLGETGDDAAANLSAWLLPQVKFLGGETAFGCASGAIQVLGGAGYTAEWPAEQALRDARVLPVFEGTTGMQAQDLVLRRLIRDSAAFNAFVDEANKVTDPRFCAAFETFTAAAALLRDSPDDAEARATDMLRLSADIALGWIAARYLMAETTDPFLRTASGHWLDSVAGKARAHYAEMLDAPQQAARMDILREMDAGSL